MNAIKRGTITWEQYVERYTALMRQRYSTERGRQDFDHILAAERVVLLCYCDHHMTCHRILAAQILVKIAESRGLEVDYQRELRTDRQRRRDRQTARPRLLEDE